MKNKLIVMFLTFIVLIILTPLIFEKLMNSKFDSMLLRFSQQNGIKIKEIKNNSSYLTTQRVFDVIVPGSAIDQNEIKYIEFQTDIKFKNLPITNVEFLNVLKKIVLKNNKTIPFIKDKIKILVITPDFKVYKYKIFNNKIDMPKADITLSWQNFNGVYDEKTKTLKNENGLIEFKNTLNRLKIYNIKTFLQDTNNLKLQQLHFNADFSNPKLKAQIVNFNSKSSLKFSNDTVNIDSNTNLDKINVNNMFKLNNLSSDFKLNGIDKNIYEKIKNKKYTKKDIDELLEKGFKGKFDLNIKNIFFMQNLGFVNLKSTFSIKNANLNQINSKKIDFLDLNVTFETSPEFINIAGNFFKPIKQMAKIENNKAVIKIVINKGNININGQKIKSY